MRLAALLLIILFFGQCYEPAHRAKGNVLPIELQETFKTIDLSSIHFYNDCARIESQAYQIQKLPASFGKLLKLPNGAAISTSPEGKVIPIGKFMMQNQYQALLFDVLDTACNVLTCINILDVTLGRLTNYSHALAYTTSKNDETEIRNAWFADYDIDGKLDLITRTVIKKDGLVLKDYIEVRMWDMFEFRPLGMVNEKLLKERYVVWE